MPFPEYFPYLSTLTDDQLFTAANVVLPAWILIAIAPRSQIAKVAVYIATFVIAAIYGVVLFGVLVPKYGGLLAFISQFNSLEGVAKLFSDRTGVLVGWYDYSFVEKNALIFACFAGHITWTARVKRSNCLTDKLLIEQQQDPLRSDRSPHRILGSSRWCQQTHPKIPHRYLLV